jgi:hypothetical protein
MCNKYLIIFSLQSQPVLTASSRPLLTASRRFLCDSPARLTEGEKQLSQRLKMKFPSATAIQVQDISGE